MRAGGFFFVFVFFWAWHPSRRPFVTTAWLTESSVAKGRVYEAESSKYIGIEVHSIGKGGGSMLVVRGLSIALMCA